VACLEVGRSLTECICVIPVVPQMGETLTEAISSCSSLKTSSLVRS
jgi:hypothetical protein